MAWGWNAAKRLSELSPSEAAEHWYIEDFKLALQDENKAAEIRAKGLTPEQVNALHAGACAAGEERDAAGASPVIAQRSRAMYIRLRRW